jgi:hypothetical protein
MDVIKISLPDPGRTVRFQHENYNTLFGRKPENYSKLTGNMVKWVVVLRRSQREREKE